MNIGPYIDESKRQGQPMAWIMMGAAGAGKTTWIKQHVPGFAKWVDIDAINKALFRATPENYQDTLLDASMKSFEMFYKTLKAGESAVMDATGGNAKRIKKQFWMAKKNGYKIFLVYLDVPLTTALKQAKQRGVGGDRDVGDEAVIYTWNKVQDSWAQVKRLPWDKVYHIKR